LKAVALRPLFEQARAASFGGLAAQRARAWSQSKNPLPGPGATASPAGRRRGRWVQRTWRFDRHRPEGATWWSTGHLQGDRRPGHDPELPVCDPSLDAGAFLGQV